MSIEGGARAGLVAPDEKTYAYLKGRPKAPQGMAWDMAVDYWRTLVSDADASFDAVVELEGGDIVPQVSWGTSPEMVAPVTGHVPDPASVVKACSTLVKPGGWVFFSTLNRNPKSFLFAIVGAEYILNLLPKGTHEYARLIKPSELADWARIHGLDVKQMKGMTYNPFTRHYALGTDTDVNYLMATQKPLTN
jgi:SAM-dependent methyltransferase